MRKLTKRQQEIEDLLLLGYNPEKIGEILEKTPSAVNNLRTQIYKKRDVHSIAELLALRYKDIMQENRMLKKQIENLTVYKQRWEYLTNKYFKERED